MLDLFLKGFANIAYEKGIAKPVFLNGQTISDHNRIAARCVGHIRKIGYLYSSLNIK